MRYLPRLALLGTLVATAGCPGTLEDPARFLDAAGATDGGGGPTIDGDLSDGGPGAPTPDAANCPDVPQKVFATSCTGVGCHNAQTKEQGLDLQSPGLAARLVGVSATEGPGLLIDPSAPSSSVLYTKLTASPPFGARMPLGSQLDDATLACVLSWIVETAGGGAQGAGDAGDDGPSQQESGP